MGWFSWLFRNPRPDDWEEKLQQLETRVKLMMEIRARLIRHEKRAKVLMIGFGTLYPVLLGLVLYYLVSLTLAKVLYLIVFYMTALILGALFRLHCRRRQRQLLEECEHLRQEHKESIHEVRKTVPFEQALRLLKERGVELDPGTKEDKKKLLFAISTLLSTQLCQECRHSFSGQIAKIRPILVEFKSEMPGVSTPKKSVADRVVTLLAGEDPNSKEKRAVTSVESEAESAPEPVRRRRGGNNPEGEGEVNGNGDKKTE